MKLDNNTVVSLEIQKNRYCVSNFQNEILE